MTMLKVQHRQDLSSQQTLTLEILRMEDCPLVCGSIQLHLLQIQVMAELFCGLIESNYIIEILEL